jgi:hypothetical protein
MEHAVQSLFKAVELDPSIMEIYGPLEYLLLRSGRTESARSIRRARIVNEIRLSHVEGIPGDPGEIRRRAVAGAASAADLCTLSVLAWIEGDPASAMEHARAAVEKDPAHIQAKGNLLFLLVEQSTERSYAEALEIGRAIENLLARADAHATPSVHHGGERIVFGRILTFVMPTRIEAEARRILQVLRDGGEPDGGTERISALVQDLLNPAELPLAQDLWAAARDRFPDENEIKRLKLILDSQARKLW